MDSDLIQRRQRELSKQQAIYVAKRMQGHTKQQSAILAGYADVDKAGDSVEKSPVVKEELARARAEAAKAVNVTKEDIAQGLIDAADMARVMGDPGAMVRAYTELGKFLGLQAPEVKKHEHSVKVLKNTSDAVKNLPDEDLYKLANGRVIEGEATRVDD